MTRHENLHPRAPMQGRALNESADKDCKVIVVGNPCNTNALIAMENAPRLNRRCGVVGSGQALARLGAGGRAGAVPSHAPLPGMLHHWGRVGVAPRSHSGPR